MNDLVLYQKYRPSTFSEILGQDHIVKVLKNEVITGNISNSYLFFGLRGVGKTSIARIFAKAANCLDLEKNGDPCNKCSVCQDINSGAFIDLIEIDAASNRGIDDIRDIKNKVQFLPSMGKFKIYIIDEVHMLTIDAFNALLKTLEEPPSSVVFILATTTVQKIPATIISRCQRFDFDTAKDNDLLKYLKKVVKNEKKDIGDDILSIIVKNSEGSFRDSLSILQKIINLQGNIKLEDALEIIGIADSNKLCSIWNNLFSGKMLDVIYEVEGNNLNAEVFIKESLDMFRKTLIYRYTNAKEFQILNLNIENIENENVLKIINILISSLDHLHISSLPILSLDILFMNVINLLEIKVDNKKINKKKSTNETLNTNKDLSENIKSEWGNIIEESIQFNHHISAFLKKSSFKLNKNTLEIIVPFPFYKDMLDDKKTNEFLKNLFNKKFETDLTIKCIVDKSIKPIIQNKQENEINDDINEIFDIDNE